MCDYCGCQQSVQAIADLTAEHDAAVALLGGVRDAVGAGDLGAVAVAAREIAGLLAPHTAVEEEGLFPALAADFPDHVACLEGEHRLVEGVLAEAADGVPSDPSWPGRLLEAMTVLREHILAEQDGVFPAALAQLVPADWDAVDEVRARVGSSLHVTTTP